MSTSLFSEVLCRSCKSITAKIVQMGDSKLVDGELILLPLSLQVYLCLVMKYWPIVGTCRCHSHSKLCHSFHLTFFNLLLLPTTPLHSMLPIHHIKWFLYTTKQFSNGCHLYQLITVIALNATVFLHFHHFVYMQVLSLIDS